MDSLQLWDDWKSRSYFRNSNDRLHSTTVLFQAEMSRFLVVTGHITYDVRNGQQVLP